MSQSGQSRRLSDVGMSASPPTSDVRLRRTEPTLWATNRHPHAVMACRRFKDQGRYERVSVLIWLVAKGRHDQDPETSRDSRRRCGRLQPSSRRGRRSRSVAAAGAAEMFSLIPQSPRITGVWSSVRATASSSSFVASLRPFAAPSSCRTACQAQVSSCVLAFVWPTSFRRFGESSAAMTVTVAVKT